MKKLKNTRVVGTAVITVVLACCHSLKPEGPEATITSVEPQTISSTKSTPLKISGDTFSVALLRDVGCGHGTAIATNDAYDVEFISVEDESTVFYSPQVNWLDDNTLEAWIDAGSLPPGEYSIRVIDPWGRPSQLLDAIEVVASQDDGEFDTDSDPDSQSDEDPDSSNANTDVDSITCSAPDTACDTDSGTWDSTTLDSGGGDDTGSGTDSDPSCEEVCERASNSFIGLACMIPDSTDVDEPVWDYGTDSNGRNFWATGLGENYGACESAGLASPEVDLTPCSGKVVALRFFLDYQYDPPLGGYDTDPEDSGHKDGLTIKFYNGNTKTWETVDPEEDDGYDWELVTHSYAPNDTDECSLEIEEHRCFTGSSNGRIEAVFRLDWGEFPDDFRFRLIHGSDWTKDYDGTYFKAVDFGVDTD